MDAEVFSLRQELADESIGVFIDSALPGRVRVGEVELDPGMRQNDGFLIWETAQPGTTGYLALEWMLERSRTEATGSILLAAERQRGST